MLDLNTAAAIDSVYLLFDHLGCPAAKQRQGHQWDWVRRTAWMVAAHYFLNSERIRHCCV